ncbi:hypothetical protein J3A83DRAFT_4184666 [Scleroderma citrinum]
MGESTMVQLNPQQACIALVVEESTLVVGHSNITHPVVLYNPMGLLAMAAMKVKITTVPPIPELPVKCNLGMTHISEAKHPKNLCQDNKVEDQIMTIRYKKWLWLNPNGQKDNFCIYYDKMLTLAQCKVKMNGWTKVVIELGMLY